MKPCVIFDIDGTLANIDHRRYLVDLRQANGGGIHRKKDWKEFFGRMTEDTPHEPVATIFKALRQYGLGLVTCSGRAEIFRKRTWDWLNKHDLTPDRMYFRADNDHREDTDVKRDLLKQIRLDGFDPKFVLDDRNSVVQMWRDAGLMCLQVAPGDF